jgi:hypothetical protein
MRHIKWLVLTLLTAGALVPAQEKPAAPVPEYLNEIQYIQPSTKALVKLEKVLSKMVTKTKLLGFGGASNYYPIDNEKSPVRIPASESVAFVINPGEGGFMGMMDPSQLISLYKVESKGSARQLTVQSGGGMFSSGKNKSSSALALSFRKSGNVIEITTTKPLEKGEYAFQLMTMGMMNGAATLFAFGID